MVDSGKKIDIYSDTIGFVQYVSHMGSDVTVVNSARVSFGKNVSTLSGSDIKLIKYLIKNKHTSTLEHNVITFRFKVPLFIRSQHHRHRTWSYNEISRRYTDVNLEFYEPVRFRKQSSSNRQASVDEYINPIFPVMKGVTNIHYVASRKLKSFHKEAVSLYNNLIEHGVCREQARGVLPQNLYTEYYGTVNLNNLFKFIDLRVHEGAQWEIQQVAKACLKITKDLFPVTVQSYMEVNEGRKK
jgi:thymidylate synthase (FAD)